MESQVDNLLHSIYFHSKNASAIRTLYLFNFVDGLSQKAEEEVERASQPIWAEVSVE